MGTNVLCPKVPGFGYDPLKICRNGTVLDAYAMAAVASGINMIAGRRMKVHLTQWMRPEDALASPTATDIFFFESHSSPNIKDLRIRMLLVPGDSSHMSGSVGPQYQWTVNSVAQTVRYTAAKSTGASSYGPNDIIQDEIVVVDGSGNSFAGNTKIQGVLNVDNGCRVIGCCVYETTRETLAVGTDTCVNTADFAVGAPVYDRNFNQLHETLWTLYGRQGAQHIHWTVKDGSPVTQTGATFKNVLDASTGGYASTSPGFYVWPKGRRRTVTTTEPVTLWCYAKVNTGTTGQVRFIGSAGTIGTITVNSTTAGFFSTTATLDGTATDDLVTVSIADSGGNTISCYAAGMYHYV